MKPIRIYLKKLQQFAGFRLYLNMLCMLLLSFVDSMGILLILPMLSVIGFADSSAIGIPIVSQLMQPLAGLPGDWQLPVVLGGYLFIMLATGWLQRSQSVLAVSIQQGFIRHLRVDTYQRLIEADWSFFLRQRRSDFQHMLTSELARVSQGVHLFLTLVRSGVFAAIQLLLAFMLSPELTLFILASGLAIGLPLRRFVRRSKLLGDRTSELSQSYYSALSDHFNGMKEMKSNRLEMSHLSWFRTLCQRMERNIVEMSRLQSISQFYYKLASAVLIALFVFFSLRLLQVQSGQLLLIIVIFARLWPRFSAIQSNMEQLYSSIPAFDRLISLKRECEEARELALEQGLSAEPLPLREALECRGAYFRYNRQEGDCALRNIHLHIPAGSMTAIVGKSGAGKSTLIDLLMGLIRPEKGEVYVDGQPLVGERLAAFRHSVSYVSQEPFLFHTTLRENMLLVKPNATEPQIWQALQFAAADEFVRQLPQGLDTVLGDRGERLSGGERQRIVLARAILRKPALLILDEATSALDLEHEAKIRQAIDRLKGKVTIIMIAHRLPTIRYADQVLVMERGELIQQGGYQQLSSDSKGRFSKWLHMHMEQSSP